MSQSAECVEYCRNCGKSTEQVGKLSYRGKCTACSRAAVEAAPTEMMNGTGPVGEKWARNLKAGVERRAAQGGTPL